MSDNERIVELREDLLDAVNTSPLPLAVKAMALENLLLRVQNAMLQEPTLKAKEASENA